MQEGGIILYFGLNISCEENLYYANLRHTHIFAPKFIAGLVASCPDVEVSGAVDVMGLERRGKEKGERRMEVEKRLWGLEGHGGWVRGGGQTRL